MEQGRTWKRGFTLRRSTWTTLVNAWGQQTGCVCPGLYFSRDCSVSGSSWNILVAGFPAEDTQNSSGHRAHFLSWSESSEDPVSGPFWFAGQRARCWFSMCVTSSAVTLIFESKTFVLKGHTRDSGQRTRFVYFSSVLLERWQYYNYGDCSIE